ncbi:polysaccharide biosynthesis tyrosine autokinase [Novosphingobium resinovorum]|uniref:GumC family protein n=1 Tax=Novosphingobium resinovorum TaxID=158500 RepID=UPI002ED00DBB|nr:polysaccharide biosynthesis tyrosine autokinase [Novosphingobium resinovorum]
MKHRKFGIISDEVLPDSAVRILPDASVIAMIVFRRRWLLLGAFTLTVALAASLLALLPRTYTATAALLLEPRETEPVKVNDRGFVAPADDNLIDTAVQIIRSPMLTLDVVRGLDLADTAEFGGGKPDALASKSAETYVPVVDRERRAARTLLANSYAKRVGVTYLIEISASSIDPKRAALIANALARRYIDLDTAKKRSRNTQAAHYVQSQAAALRRQAVSDDAALQAYMIRNNLMSAQGATMAEQEVSELNRQIADAQAQLAEQRGKLGTAQSQIARGGGGADIGTALASETVRQLRQQEAQASARLAQLDARYGSLHPDVVEAKNELADVRGQLAAELARIVSGLRGDVQIAESRLGSLEMSRAQAKGALAQNNSAQVGRLELERRAEASRAIYNAYLTRAKETAQAGALPNADASIASVAPVPNVPSSPNYALGALAALGTALVAGFATIALAEYLEGTVATRGDIEIELGAIYAGAIPTLNSATRSKAVGITPQDYVTMRPMSLFTESIRNLATYLGLSSGGNSTVVTITSPLPREGKSTTSMCLARTLAMGKRKVVLVDADVRHHSTSDALAPNRVSEGLFRVLDGTEPIERALTADDRSSLQILTTLGQSSPDDVITQEALATLIANLRARFDIVVIDSAPVLGVAETRLAAQLSDITLVVVRWRKTPAKAVRTTLDLLIQSGSKIGGVALSLVDIKEFASAGLTDAFGYYKKFKGYYVD